MKEVTNGFKRHYEPVALIKRGAWVRGKSNTKTKQEEV